MLRRTALLALVPLTALTLVAAAATQAQTRTTATTTKSTLVKIQAQILIKATPAHVWQVLTTTEGLGTLTGIKGMEAGKTVTKVGDNFTGTVWSDTGAAACTFFLAGKELRVAFEPTTGGYLCQDRILIQQDPSNGTMLTVLDRYTDDKTDTVDKTALTVASELTAHLDAFRVMVEMP
jgi:hypothetical protein